MLLMYSSSTPTRQPMAFDDRGLSYGALSRSPRPGGSVLAAVMHNRGVLRQTQGKLAAALADFDRALDLVPGQIMTLRARGMARKAAGNLKGALADLDRAVALTPPAPPAAAAAVLHERGGVKALLDDWAGAIADYDEALALDEKFWLAYVSRGHARCHIHDFGGVADYRKALRLNPEGALREIARLVREDSALDAESALTDCDEQLRSDDRDPIARVRRCLTLALLGRDADAAEELERFRALAPHLAGTLGQILDA